jgi:hypothetical protein
MKTSILPSSPFPSLLAARVAARNQVNSLANEWGQKYLAFLAPYIGKKIRKIGAFTKAFEADLQAAGLELPSGGNINYAYLHCQYKDVSLAFRVGNYILRDWYGREDQKNISEEDSIYLGKLDDNGVLLSLYPLQPQRTDYTEAEILTARKEVQAAKDSLRAAEGKLCCFGEYES